MSHAAHTPGSEKKLLRMMHAAMPLVLLVGTVVAGGAAALEGTGGGGPRDTGTADPESVARRCLPVSPMSPVVPRCLVSPVVSRCPEEEKGGRNLCRCAGSSAARV